MVLDVVRAARDGGERGQGLVEYSLVLALVSIAVAGSLAAFGSQSSGLYGHILAAISAVTASL
jgi:Flp pilus assembly pilin Flp